MELYHAKVKLLMINLIMEIYVLELYERLLMSQHKSGPDKALLELGVESRKVRLG